MWCRAERQYCARSANPTTSRRWHWHNAVQLFRWAVKRLWKSIESNDQRISYYETAIREEQFTEAPRRRYAKDIESLRKWRAESFEQLQRLADAEFRSY